MPTEFDDNQHYGVFATGPTLTSSTGKFVRQSELTMAALRAAGVFENMVDGLTPPATDKLWLDKNFDPAVLKEWDATGSSWEPVTFARLFGRAVVTPLGTVAGDANAAIVEQPQPFMNNRLYSLTPAYDNTGAVTLQVIGVGTYPVRYEGGADIQPRELRAGYSTILYFTGSAFVVLFATAGINDSVDQAIGAAELAQAWAEGTEPDGEDTKSAREWSEEAESIKASIDALASTFQPFVSQIVSIGGATQSIDIGNPNAVKEQVWLVIDGVFQLRDTFSLTSGVIAPIGDPWPSAQAEVYYVPAFTLEGGTVADGSINAAKLADGAVTEPKLAAGLPLIRNSSSTSPVNEERLYLSPKGWNPQTDKVYARSTPETAILAVGGHFDEWGAPSRNYLWGISGWMTNGNVAPITVGDFLAQGWNVRGVGATARQVGSGGDGHALEIIIGQYDAAARFNITSGSNVLTRTNPVFKVSRFTIGDRVLGPGGTNTAPGEGIPASTFITALTKNGQVSTGMHVYGATVATAGSGWAVGDRLRTNTSATRVRYAELEVRTVSGGSPTSFMVIDPGDYSAAPSGSVGVIKVGGGETGGLTINLELIAAGVADPDTITMSKNATANGSNRALYFRPATADGNTMNIGLLITGSGDGGHDGSGNPNGRGIQFQSYGEALLYRGMVFGPTCLRDSDGIGIEFSAGNTARRAVSIEDSSTYSDTAVYIANNDQSALSINRRNSDGTVQHIRRQGSIVGSISVTSGGTTFNSLSDERMKDFEKASLDGGDVIKELSGILAPFTWKADGSPDYGVSAQQAYKILPQLVAPGKGEPEDEDFEPWQVDWSKAVPRLIAYCAKLEQRLAALENGAHR